MTRKTTDIHHYAGSKAGIWLIGCLLVIIGASSCKSKKKLVETEKVAVSNDMVAWEQALANDLELAELSLSGDLSASINGENQSSAFNIRIERGKQIWLVLRPMLGIEVFRVLITPDSLRMVDRINKQYYEKPFSYLNQLAGTQIDYQTLENLLLNNLGHLSSTEIRKSTIVGYDYLAQRGDMRFNIALRAELPKCKTVLAESGDKNVRIDYQLPSQVDGNWAPASLKAILNGNENNGISLNFTKFAVENGQTYPYSVPKNYSRAD